MKKRAGPDNAAEKAPATNPGGSTPEDRKEAMRIAHSAVSELPVELQELVKQLLIEGATFEDVVEAVNERGAEGVTLEAVEHFSRSDPGLQQQRVQWQLDTAKLLKQASDDPGSLEGQLLEAIILTGLMRVTRQGTNFDLPHAMRQRIEQENLYLKNQLLRLKVQKSVQEKSYKWARTRAEVAKAEAVESQLQKLLRALEGVQKNKKLDAQTFEKIKEIYGLIKAPLVIATNPENSGARI